MSSNLRVQELDFDTLKGNLRDFLRTKPEFTDYDFEGSGLNALLNILSYNTHYMALLANLQMGELFLDTASKRESAALHASRMGYVPNSMRAPFAKVNLEIFPTGSPATLTIGRGATFKTTISGNDFSFVTLAAKTISRSSSGRYVFNDLSIHEGTLKQFRYSVANNTEYVIPTKSVDINSLIVKVQVSSSNSTTTVFQRNKSIADITSDSSVYYLRLNQRGFYEVYFGDGVLSKALDPENIVILEYLETNGELANGAKLFSFDDLVEGHSSNLVTVIDGAYGGDSEESIDGIRFNAQAQLGTQNRAVTSSDYLSAIREIYPVQDIAVWGGEFNSPPQYGKVFISIRPTGGAEILTTSTKEFIKSELVKKKNVLTVTPEIVDPKYTYIEVNSTVYYDDRLSEYSSSSVEMLVKETISDFTDSTLGVFNSSFRYSKLSKAIDDTIPSIKSNITTIKLKKNELPENLSVSGYSIAFGNPLIRSTVDKQYLTSTGFNISESVYTMYIDDMDGILRLFYYDGAVKKVFDPNIGTIDYESGILTFNNLDVTYADNNNVSITAIPVSNDVFSLRENIVDIIDSDVSVTAIVESVDVNSHIFTASR